MSDHDLPIVMATAAASYVALGNVSISVTATDASSNIERVFCAVDSSAAPAEPCAGLSGLPATNGDYAGAIQLTKLSPGNHSVAIVAVDHAGNASAVLQLTFELAYPTPAGHLFVIGSDLVQANGSSVDKVVGNAVFASRASSFDRPLRVVLADVGAGATTTESDHVKSAVCQRVKQWRTDSCTCTGELSDCVTFSSASGNSLTAPLIGNDVLVLLDQNATTASTLGAAATPDFIDALRRFATDGGIVIALNGGVADTSTPSHTLELVKPLVKLDIADAALGNATATRECYPEDPLAVDPSAAGVTSFAAAGHMLRFVNLERGTAEDTNEIFVSDQGCAGACAGWQPVAIDKYFPARTNRGPLYMHAYDDNASPITLGRAIIGSSMGPISCAMHVDGTLAAEVEAGSSSVTIADSNHVGFFQTLYDTVPYESVTIGRTHVTPAATRAVQVSWPAYINAIHYTVSTGCGPRTTTENPDSEDPPALSATVTVGERCRLPQSEGFGVLVLAIDANRNAIAYQFATFVDPAQPVTLGNAWHSSPPRLHVGPLPAFSPLGGPVPWYSANIALAHGGVLFDSSYDQYVSSFGLQSSSPSPFAVSMRGKLTLRYQDGGSGTFAISMQTSGTDRAMDVRTSDVLPVVTSITSTGTPNAGSVGFVTSSLLWAGQSTTLTLGDAVGGVVILQTQDTCAHESTWRLMFTPKAQQSSLPLPIMPVGITCVPIPNSTNVSLRVFSDSGVGVAAARRSMQDLNDTFDFETERAIGIVRRTSELNHNF